MWHWVPVVGDSNLDILIGAIKPFLKFLISDSRRAESIELIDIVTLCDEVCNCVSCECRTQAMPCHAKLSYSVLKMWSFVGRTSDQVHYLIVDLLIRLVKAFMHLAFGVAKGVLDLHSIDIVQPVFNA